MKKLLLGSVALAALFVVSSAQAADLAPPLKAPAPPVVTWSGCYVGGDAGAAWGTDKVSPLRADGATFPRTATINLNTGVFGGGTVGCNYEAAGFAVVGFEGDGGWMGLRGSVFDPPNETHSIQGGGYGDITGRLGVAWGPVLFYGKGGGAFFDGQEKTTTNLPGFIAFGTNVFAGWTAGGGVEWLFFQRWSVKAEYLYFSFGNRDSTLLNIASGTIFPYSNHLTANTVKIGINYHFY